MDKWSHANSCCLCTRTRLHQHRHSDKTDKNNTFDETTTQNNRPEIFITELVKVQAGVSTTPGFVRKIINRTCSPPVSSQLHWTFRELEIFIVNISYWEPPPPPRDCIDCLPLTGETDGDTTTSTTSTTSIPSISSISSSTERTVLESVTGCGEGEACQPRVHNSQHNLGKIRII